MNRNRGPKAPVEFMELKKELRILGVERMIKILWIRAQVDRDLAKALMGSVGILLAEGDWEKAKGAVDYALHYPDYVRYTDHGQGQVLDEIKTTLEQLVIQGQRDFALRVARYAIERGHAVAENFENDWDWTSTLKSIEEWAAKVSGDSR